MRQHVSIDPINRSTVVLQRGYPEVFSRERREEVKGEKHTWFWMRSLTRSMGAAAVLETAAETPPTIIVVSFLDRVYLLSINRPSIVRHQYASDGDYAEV